MDHITKFYKSNLQPSFEKYAADDGKLSTTMYVTGAAIITAALLWRSSRLSTSKNRKQTKRKKNKGEIRKEDEKPVPMTLEKKIENVSLRFKDEYSDKVQRLLEDFDAENEKDVYQRNFYNEMLLKLLIELDGVDLIDVEGERKVTLKERRKAIIKEIQAELKKLDKLT